MLKHSATTSKYRENYWKVDFQIDILGRSMLSQNHMNKSHRYRLPYVLQTCTCNAFFKACKALRSLVLQTDLSVIDIHGLVSLKQKGGAYSSHFRRQISCINS